MATISPGENEVTIETGFVENDDYEEIYLRIEVGGREPEMWYMQRHEAMHIIRALSVVLFDLMVADCGARSSE